MTFDWTDWLKMVVSPAAGAIGGWVVARVHAVKAFEKSVSALRGDFISLKNEVSLGIESQGCICEGRIKALKETLEEAVEQVNRLRDTQSNFAKDTELHEFVKEANLKWIEISALLGEIRGELRAAKQRRIDSPIPR
jgi:tRNA U54 and U55 pseudouridine synthase Pus10